MGIRAGAFHAPWGLPLCSHMPPPIIAPQAATHFPLKREHKLSLPVYKNELDKVFQLIKDVEDNYPPPSKTLLINREAILHFSFVNGGHDYKINFELTSDFYLDTLKELIYPHYPKCKVLTWSYNGREFWDLAKNQVIVLAKPLEFNKIQELVSLIEKQPLGISQQNFIDMTTIENNIWTLKDVLDKANLTL